MGRAVRIALERDRGNCDHGPVCELFLQFGVFGFPVCNPESPAIVVDHDCDVVRVVEGSCAARERRVVEVPLR